MGAPYPPRAALRGRVGLVVPVWFPPETAPAAMEALLAAAFQETPDCLAPAQIVAVVDGCPAALAVLQALRERWRTEAGAPFDLLALPENRGKGAAVLAGIRRLLGGEAPEWIAVRDADGDHLLDDLPHLFRAGLEAASDGAPVCVIGARSRLDAPLGWLRSEYEQLLDEVVTEGVVWALARQGRVWDTRFLRGRIPDLQSGYKLYSREAARLAAEALEAAEAAAPELALLRTGVEIVPFVALALAGGRFAEAERKTFFDQPVTSYGRERYPLFYGRKLLWALRRCELPAAGAAVLLDAALLRRPLYCDTEGRAALLELRRFVLQGLAGEGAPIPDGPAGPRLV